LLLYAQPNTHFYMKSKLTYAYTVVPYQEELLIG